MGELKARGIRLLFLAVASWVLALLAWRWQSTRDVKKIEIDQSKLVFSGLKINKITTISLTTTSGQFELHRDNEDGFWRIVRPHALDADNTVIEGLLKFVGDLRVTQVLSDPKTDILGLDVPKLSMVLNSSDGSQYGLEIGVKNSYDGSLSVRRLGEKQALVVTGDLEFQADKDLHDLREKRLLTIDSGSISEIRVRAGDLNNVLSVQPDGAMHIASHGNFPVDKSQAEALLAGLANMNAAEFYDDVTSETLERLGLNTPDVDVHVVLKEGSGNAHILIKENKSEAFAMVEGKSTAIRLGNTQIVKRLRVSVDELRDHHIFSVDPDAIASLQIRKADMILTLTKHGAKDKVRWIIEGHKKEALASAVQGLLYRLSHVRGDRIDDVLAKEDPKGVHSFARPMIELKATDASGALIGWLRLAESQRGTHKTASGPVGTEPIRITEIAAEALGDISADPADYYQAKETVQ